MFRLALVVSALASLVCGAAEIGDKLPVLDLKYQLNGPVKFPIETKKDNPDAEKRLLLLEFFGSYWPGSTDMVMILNGLQERYAPQGLKVLAISGEPAKSFEEFAGKHPEIKFTLARDPDYLVSRQTIPGDILLPVAVIANGTGKIVWAGDAGEVPDALTSIYGGTYDESARRKIMPLYSALSAAVRTGSVNEVASVTERMLDLEPTNLAAIQARLFVHESNAELDKGWKFLQRHRERNPKEPLWYALSVSYGARNAEYAAGGVECAQDFLKRFPQAGAEEVTSMAWDLVNGYAYSLPALEAVRTLMKQAPQDSWRAEAVRALLGYRECNLEAAKKHQDNAVKLASAAQVNTAQLEGLRQVAAFFAGLR